MPELEAGGCTELCDLCGQVSIIRVTGNIFVNIFKYFCGQVSNTRVTGNIFVNIFKYFCGQVSSIYSYVHSKYL